MSDLVGNQGGSYVNSGGLFEPCHEETNNMVSEQFRHKPSCASTEDG